MITCCVCGASMKDRRAMSVHAKKHAGSPVDIETIVCDSMFGRECVEKTVHDYVGEMYCVHDLPIDIAKLLSLRGLKRTSSQERHTQRYRDKYNGSIRAKYGDITNVSQAACVQKKKEESFAKRFGSYEQYMSCFRAGAKDGYRRFLEDGEAVSRRTENVKTTMMNRYGVTNPSQIDSVRMANSKKAKDRFARMTTDEKRQTVNVARKKFYRNVAGRKSNIEDDLASALIEIGYVFSRNKKIGRYSFDFVFGNSFIVEVNGDHWHANPKLYKPNDIVAGSRHAKDVWAHDRIKAECAAEKGYEVMTIWESEIKHSGGIAEAAAKIKAKLSNRYLIKEND